MGVDITVKIGGEAGQGIQTLGILLAAACRKGGYYVMAVNDFESRIRGGHSFYQLRICDRPVWAPSAEVHLLVALSPETIPLHAHELAPQACILNGRPAEGSAAQTSGGGTVLDVSFDKIAQEAGGGILSNTVAAGACLSLLGAPFDLAADVLKDEFQEKGNQWISANQKAAKLGFAAVESSASQWSLPWGRQSLRAMLLDGAKSIALGAVASDCRLAAFYPMSPATGIMAHLAAWSDKLPLVVEQAEDELAAANMIIGAAFAGVRAITATSGGGFSLMTEALGLAGITETPVVIINAQRPGPATGLPTRTAQADLLFVIHASQDEFPRFVFAPGNPQQAYEITARACRLAEKYQVPAIMLSDQYLNDSLYTVDVFKIPDAVERFGVNDSDLEDPANYRHFQKTPDGVSPRALPCKGKALVVVSSDEHREDGHISENAADRVSMADKRSAKIPAMLNEMQGPESYHGEAAVLLVGWGSTWGALREAVDMLRSAGHDAGSLHFTDLWPFPAEAASAALAGCRAFYMVENNATSQLGKLMRKQTGLIAAGVVLKYDGRPFYPTQIAAEMKIHLKKAQSSVEAH